MAGPGLWQWPLETFHGIARVWRIHWLVWRSRAASFPQLAGGVKPPASRLNGSNSMSHFTTLPTVLRDADLLVASLESLQLKPQRHGRLVGFAGEEHPVDVLVDLDSGLRLGWRRQGDGSLALVGDLPRLSRGATLPALLGTITRTYAARLALREASAHLPEAVLELAR